jgi:hypothetical protein
MFQWRRSHWHQPDNNCANWALDADTCSTYAAPVQGPSHDLIEGTEQLDACCCITQSTCHGGLKLSDGSTEGQET